MSVSLYRRFRPDTFQKLIGQDHIARTLINQIKNGRVSHAYLFTGTRGTGKTSTAKIFAKAVNCLSPVDGSPCGECAVCKALSNPANLDILEIDAASNNGVDEIRELKENVSFAPTVGKYKVYIIDEVHMLSPSAFNALLKTIEEPPPHVVFILATTEVQKLPQTVMSRCQRFDFRLVSTKLLRQHLKNVFDEIGVAADDRALELIARHGEGSVRDTLSLADMMVSFSDGQITGDAVEEALGVSSFDLLTSLASCVLSGNVRGLLETLDTVADMGKNQVTLAKDLAEYMLNLVSVKNLPRQSVELNDDEYQKASALLSLADDIRLTFVVETLADLESELRYTTQPRVMLTALLVKAASKQADQSIEGLLSRLRAVEKKLDGIESGSISVAMDTKTVAKPKKADAELIAESPLLAGATVVAGAVVDAEPTAEVKEQMAVVLELLKDKKEIVLLTVLQKENDVVAEDGVLVVTASSSEAYEMLTYGGNDKLLDELAKTAGAAGLRVKLKEGGDQVARIDDTAVRRLSSLFGDLLTVKKK